MLPCVASFQPLLSTRDSLCPESASPSFQALGVPSPPPPLAPHPDGHWALQEADRRAGELPTGLAMWGKGGAKKPLSLFSMFISKHQSIFLSVLKQLGFFKLYMQKVKN